MDGGTRGAFIPKPDSHCGIMCTCGIEVIIITALCGSLSKSNAPDTQQSLAT